MFLVFSFSLRIFFGITVWLLRVCCFVWGKCFSIGMLVFVGYFLPVVKPRLFASLHLLSVAFSLSRKSATKVQKIIRFCKHSRKKVCFLRIAALSPTLFGFVYVLLLCVIAPTLSPIGFRHAGEKHKASVRSTATRFVFGKICAKLCFFAPRKPTRIVLISCPKHAKASLYCPITNAIFSVLKNQSPCEGYQNRGEEIGLPRTNAIQKMKETRMFLRSKYANRKWNLFGGNMGASRGL